MLKVGINEINENPIALKLLSTNVVFKYNDIKTTPVTNGKKQHKPIIKTTSFFTRCLSPKLPMKYIVPPYNIVAIIPARFVSNDT